METPTVNVDVVVNLRNNDNLAVLVKLLEDTLDLVRSARMPEVLQAEAKDIEYRLTHCDWLKDLITVT